MSKRKHKNKITQELFSAKITGMSHDGRGISSINGKITFIFGGLIDEHIRFRYEKKYSRYDEGQAVSIINNEHIDRIQPLCNHFNVCGGCQLQHLNYPAQINYKEKLLWELLKQQGIKPNNLLPALVGNPWEYRRKARLSAKYSFKKQEMLLGFRERKSHLIAHLNHCQVLDPSVGSRMVELNNLLATLDIRESIPQLEIAITDHEKAIIIRHLSSFTHEDLLKLKQFAATYHYEFYLQAKDPDSITPLNPDKQKSKLYYDLTHYNLRLFFSPQQFIQINAEINQKMINQALDLLEPEKNDCILDLFCGIGNFSLPLGIYTNSVTGVEGEPLAVTQAQENAVYNQIDNCQFFSDDLFTVSWQPSWTQKSYNKILLDPPRAGAEVVCKNINTWRPKKLLYISCDPNTFVRDAKILIESNYCLENMGIIDMFPQTKHLEIMALFVPVSA